MTKEKLEKSPDFNEDSKCKTTLLTSTSSKADIKLACAYEDIQTQGVLHLEALSPESIKGSGEMSATGNGHTMNTNSSFTAKWIAPACGGVQ